MGLGVDSFKAKGGQGGNSREGATRRGNKAIPHPPGTKGDGVNGCSSTAGTNTYACGVLGHRRAHAVLRSSRTPAGTGAPGQRGSVSFNGLPGGAQGLAKAVF